MRGEGGGTKSGFEEVVTVYHEFIIVYHSDLLLKMAQVAPRGLLLGVKRITLPYLTTPAGQVR